MTKATITETEAYALLAEVLDEPVAKLRPDTRRADIVGWDSMGALMFMAQLDEQFGVELTADESRAMSKIGDALQFMRNHGVIRD